MLVEQNQNKSKQNKTNVLWRKTKQNKRKQEESFKKT